ncbi:MAG: hypothetical protein WCC95_22930 [Candidatus Sulfotelmatobacter sp.]|jgi:hypothetical protein
MKITLVALCFLCATAAFGQSAGVLSSNPSPISIVDHPEHASQHFMRQDDNLRGDSLYSYAKGEQPLSDFGSGKVEIPLGDVARAYRKEHAQERKAVKVFTAD